MVSIIAPKRPFLLHRSIYALVGLDIVPVFAVQADTERIDGGSGVDRASVQQQAEEGFDLLSCTFLTCLEGGISLCGQT
ncbi:MAG: hypothetical protein GY832_17220 [Chloroflexi bacterium]|nr:hypothetical protein [Chloroflexota bacterium]